MYLDIFILEYFRILMKLIFFVCTHLSI